jgi:hypothetical protein
MTRPHVPKSSHSSRWRNYDWKRAHRSKELAVLGNWREVEITTSFMVRERQVIQYHIYHSEKDMPCTAAQNSKSGRRKRQATAIGSR